MKLLALITAMAFVAALESTAASASIVLSTGSATIGPTGTATVDLNISGLTPGTTALGQYDINIGFNSGVVNFASATLGDPILGSDQLDLEGFGTINFITPGTGTVEIFELSLDSPSALTSLQPANFTLATLMFNAVATGSTVLTLSVNSLGDQNGSDLTPGLQLQNGSINVTAVPLPASAWLLLSGLVGVGAMARKRRAA